MAPANSNERLRREQRLIRPAHFRESFEQGRSHLGRYMVLWVRQAPDGCLRLGVVASRKVGGAVQRSRARRRLRAVWRLNRKGFAGTVDVVLVGRRALVDAPFTKVNAEFGRLAERAGLYGAPPREHAM